MKTLFTHSHARGELRKSSQLRARAPRARVAAFAFLMLCMFVIALVNVVPVPAQHGRDWHEAQAKKEREFQACARPWEAAFQQTIKDIQHGVELAERKAEDAYRIAARNAKTEAERAAAKKAKLEAVRKAKLDSRAPMRDAQAMRQKALESCRNPKQPEQTNNNSDKSNKPAESSERSCGGNNSAGGTLGHGPRPRNPTVRMDLRVVDETGNPVRGVKTKLWSERQSNGLSCETIHTTDPCGGVLMDPIHITKTLQLKLEARGFEPQTIQVDPSQLDKPFKAVMQSRNPARGIASSTK